MLEGLGEHWGSIDESLNPDLREIARSYAAGYFACAFEGEALVGTGAFLPVSSETVQIHRMSVARGLRRQGLGSRMLDHLLGVAHRRGFRTAMLETTETWSEVVAFYQRHGFRPYERRDGDLYLRRAIADPPPPE